MASAWPRSSAPKSGIGAGQIDEADDGSTEFLGNLHAAKRLAIALGMGHAEVALHALLRGAALAVADHQHFVIAEPRHAARHRGIVAKGAIPVNLAEIREDPLDKVHGVRPLGMARRLNSLPRRRNRLRVVG